jgi:Phosphodiester glycosidase
MVAGAAGRTTARSAFALALVVATVALWADAGGAAAERAGSVTVSRARWVGLQMDVAEVRTGTRVVVEPVQAKRSVTTLRSVVRICGGCIAGINGDFFDVHTRQPLGGVIVNGVVLRSPSPRQNQLSFRAGEIVAGPMEWLGQISFGATTMPVAVNDPRAGTPVLYNRRFGAKTPPGHAVELRFGRRHSAALRLGRRRLVYRGTHRPGRPIPAGTVVLRASGTYGRTLRQLEPQLRTGQARLTIDLATNPMAPNSLGANHILLRGGRIQPIAENDAFVNGAYPRTIFGWNEHGRIWLVTIGSAVPGRRAGVSLRVAAKLVRNLGATDAVNLDGGGSSTFVAHGRIRNHPSGGKPRRVPNAWVVVRRGPDRRPAASASATRSVGGRVPERALDDATHDAAGVAEGVGVAPGASEDEPAFERGDDRGRETACVVGRKAGRREARRRGVDPAREHLRGRDAQRLVRARHLSRDRADRARVDEVGLLEHRRRPVEEVGDRCRRARRLARDRLEELAVGGARARDHGRGEVVLAPGEEVVERAGRRPSRHGHVLHRRAVVAPPAE